MLLSGGGTAERVAPHAWVVPIELRQQLRDRDAGGVLEQQLDIEVAEGLEVDVHRGHNTAMPKQQLHQLPGVAELGAEVPQLLVVQVLPA